MKKGYLFAAVITVVMLIMIFLKTSSNSLSKYEEFLKQNYSADNIKVIMADLIHDGHDEMIVLERLETDYFSGVLHIYRISESGDVVEIYKDDVEEAQAGWRWYYLFKDADGKEYLIQYIPGIFGSSGVFALDVISFASDGSYSRNNIAEVTYDTVHFSEEQQQEMNTKLEEFKEILFQYKNASEQLIGVGSDGYILEEDSMYFGENINAA